MKTFLSTLVCLLMFTSVYGQTKDETKEDETSLSFFQEVWRDFFPGAALRKQRKYSKKMVKKMSDEDLSEFIRNLETTENHHKITALREFPDAFYTFLGLWYNCHKRNKKTGYHYFAAAHRIDSLHALSKDDLYLLEKIAKYNKKYNKRLGKCYPGYDFRSGEGLRELARDFSSNYKKESEKDKREVEDKYNAISKDVIQLQGRSKTISQQIDSLRNLIKSKTVAIENLSLANYQSALAELEKFKGDKKSQLSGTVTKNLEGGARLVAKDAVKIGTLNPKVAESGYQLGMFCTDEIKNATNRILKGVLDLVEFEESYGLVPESYRDSVFIKLTLTGKADGHKIARKKDGTCSLIYNDDQPVSGKYYSNAEKRVKNVSFKKGDPICDEDLAFLRCHCAFEQVKTVLQKYKFPASNLKTTFNSIVYEEKGDDYRGVDLNLEAENLFHDKIETIKALQKEKALIDKEIKRKEEELGKLKIDLDEKQEVKDDDEKAVQALLKAALDQMGPGSK
jgi:hypothetical protein